MSDTRFHILDTGLGKTDPYVIVDENEKILAASCEQNGEHSKTGLLRLTNEIATLRAQLAEAREALKYIADYGNYATEGEIETSDGVMHVSDYAGKKL